MPLTRRELLRMGRLPGAWTAPGRAGELGEIVCYHKLAGLRASRRDQAHAVLAKIGALR